MSKENKTNFKTNSFKVIRTLGYKVAAKLESLHALDLEKINPNDINIPLLVDKRLGIF